MKKEVIYHCPVEAALGLVGGKYKVLILYHLIEGRLRFNELQKAVPNATSKMLIQQLKELQGDGLIERQVYPVVPPRTEYYLTELGESLIPVLEALCAWSKEHIWIEPEQNQQVG